MTKLPDDMRLGNTEETTESTELSVPGSTTDDVIWSMMGGNIKIGEENYSITSYTHELLPPQDHDWIITNEGTKRLSDLISPGTLEFTWTFTGEDLESLQEIFADIEADTEEHKKLVVTIDNHSYLCDYEFDEETGILHLEGEEIEDD